MTAKGSFNKHSEFLMHTKFHIVLSISQEAEQEKMSRAYG